MAWYYYILIFWLLSVVIMLCVRVFQKNSEKLTFKQALMIIGAAPFIVLFLCILPIGNYFEKRADKKKQREREEKEFEEIKLKVAENKRRSELRKKSIEQKNTNNMAKKPLSKEELVARLKAIAADETPKVRHQGAMCYSVMEPPEKHSKCELCGNDISYHDWDNHESIIKMVNEMIELGYDVKVVTVCKKCAEIIKKELYPNMKSQDEDGFDHFKDIWLSDINEIFYFRTSSDTEYHRAIANHQYKYKPLLCLMQNKPHYFSSQMRSHFVDEEVETLEFMTGIKFDI